MIFARPVGRGIRTSDVNIYKDLSSQVDGVSSTFDVGNDFTNLRVYYNGRNQNQCITGTVGTQFSIDFVPANGKHLAVVYDKP